MTSFKKALAGATIITVTTAVLSLIAWSSKAVSAEYFLVRDLSFEAGKYTSGQARDAYLLTPQTGELLHKTAINWDVDLLCGSTPTICWFWNNKVEAKASQAKYRHVSWTFENGINFGPVDLYYFHQSQHMLEGKREDGVKFPVEDLYMIRLNFIINPRGSH
jgi:hypothetical protein